MEEKPQPLVEHRLAAVRQKQAHGMVRSFIEGFVIGVIVTLGVQSFIWLVKN